MAMAQLGFFGPFLCQPKAWGAGDCTDEDFMALIHFWRVMGWYIGIDDK